MPSNAINRNSNTKDMEHIVTFLKVFATVAFAALVQFIMPLKSFIGVTMLLTLADLVTGIQAASKRGEAIHSRGLRRTVLKFAMYCVAILGAHAMQMVYFPTFPMVFSISAYIAVSEFWSVLENVGAVTGTNVLESVREYFSGIVKSKK